MANAKVLLRKGGDVLKYSPSLIKHSNVSAPIALSAVRWYTAPLHYRCPEFESQIEDLPDPDPYLLFHFASC